MITVETLRLWSERICGIAHGGRDVGARLFDITGPLAHDRDASSVTQLPPGVAAMRFYDDMETRSELVFVDVELAPPGITMASLVATFGEPRVMPRIHWDSPHQVIFHVTPASQPSSCDVIVKFDESPEDTSATRLVTLRRNYLFGRS